MPRRQLYHSVYRSHQNRDRISLFSVSRRCPAAHASRAQPWHSFARPSRSVGSGAESIDRCHPIGVQLPAGIIGPNLSTGVEKVLKSLSVLLCEKPGSPGQQLVDPCPWYGGRRKYQAGLGAYCTLTAPNTMPSRGQQQRQNVTLFALTRKLCLLLAQ